MTRPPRYTARLSYDDALLLWRARAVYRVQAVITGLVILVFLGELVSSFLLGFWVYGLLIVGLQWTLLRCLRWVLRWILWWTRRRLAWCLEQGKVTRITWWHVHSNRPM